jgi:hypothetical protein
LGAVDISDATADTPVGWVKLVEADVQEGAAEIDISDIVIVDDDEIEISKSGLLNKSLDLERPYELIVNGRTINSDDLNAKSPRLYFGYGNLQVTTQESDVRLVVKHPASGMVKYFKMNSLLSHSFADLPLGQYIIDARKGGRSDTYVLELTDNQTVILPITLPLFASGESKRKPIRLKSDMIQFQSEIEKRRKRQGQRFNTDWPEWAYGRCGQEPPFPLAPLYIDTIPDGMRDAFGMTTQDPMALSTFRRIPAKLPNPIQARCRITVPSMQYEFEVWKFKSGGACIPDYDPSELIANHRNLVLSFDDAPVQLKYEIRDGISKVVVASETFSTTPASLRANLGMSLENATSRLGMALDEERDQGYNFRNEIKIPDGVVRPEIRFELVGPYNLTTWTASVVNCAFPEYVDSEYSSRD